MYARLRPFIHATLMGVPAPKAAGGKKEDVVPGAELDPIAIEPERVP